MKLLDVICRSGAAIISRCLLTGTVRGSPEPGLGRLCPAMGFSVACGSLPGSGSDTPARAFRANLPSAAGRVISVSTQQHDKQKEY